jgi:hypothetical protein
VILGLGAIFALTLAANAQVAPGYYDGSQMEMGAGLKLGADGRFRFGLSYGALDESAEGRWSVVDGRVVLVSDPVTPPQFELVAQKPSAANRLEVALDVPQGLSRQLFAATIEFADGRHEALRLGDETSAIKIEAANPPSRLALSLPLFNIGSDPIVIEPARGYEFAFKFVPNDLGKVDFRDSALDVDGDDLLLRRHDRLIRFRRVAD